MKHAEQGRTGQAGSENTIKTNSQHTFATRVRACRVTRWATPRRHALSPRAAQACDREGHVPFLPQMRLSLQPAASRERLLGELLTDRVLTN